MACFSPITAFRSPKQINGKYIVKFGDIAPIDFVPIQLPCNQCIGCRLERSRQWAVRCIHEASCHKENCFITLTYNDENLPLDRSLCKSHFQKFMKRLRKHLAPKKIRYYMCGEYGAPENGSRPHYHACIFGHDFDDKELYNVRENIRTFSSDVLSDLWGKGFCTVGELNFQTAAYTARYVTKKMTGKKAEELSDLGLKHYEWLCPITGEITELLPEYTSMSLKPGIGKNWLDKYKSDVYDHDHVIVKGVKTRPPRYYDKLLENEDSKHLEELKQARQKKAVTYEANNTKERLQVRKTIQEKRFNQLKRQL